MTTPTTIPARKQVLALKQSYPCYTLQSIGDKTGISRERVRQILKSAGEHTRAWRPKRFCINCGKELILRHRPHRFCSRECLSQYHRITLECEQCHKSFSREISATFCYDNSHMHNHTFCSRQCLGQWLGTHYSKGRPRKIKED